MALGEAAHLHIAELKGELGESSEAHKDRELDHFIAFAEAMLEHAESVSEEGLAATVILREADRTIAGVNV